jgi:hypothetical protein
MRSTRFLATRPPCPPRRVARFAHCDANYDDDQGFVVTSKSKIKDAKQLNGPTVCVRSGTATQENLTNFKAWMYRAIKAIGDVGEIFEKNVDSRKDQSQIVEQNTPHEFFNHPKTDRSKDFLSKILRY